MSTKSNRRASRRQQTARKKRQTRTDATAVDPKHSSLSLPTYIRFTPAHLAAYSLIIASASFNAVFAASQGSNIVLSGIAVMAAIGSDIFKSTTPLAIASAKSWTQRLAFACLLLTCVSFSLLAALGSVSQSRDTVTSSRQAEIDKRTNLRAKIENANNELKTIRETGDPRALSVVKAALASYVVPKRIWKRTDGCKNATVKSSKKHCDPYNALRHETASATEKKKWLAERSGAQSKLDTLPSLSSQVADPLARSLSVYAQRAGWKVTEVQAAAWVPLVWVLLLEVGSTFGLALAGVLSNRPTSAHAQGAQSAQSQVPNPAQTTVGTQQPAPQKPRRANEKQVPKAQPSAALSSKGAQPSNEKERVMKAVLDWALGHDGVGTASQRILCEQMGTSKGTLGNALDDLVSLGLASVDTGQFGTRVTLTGDGEVGSVH